MKYSCKYIYPATPSQHCENCGKAISFAACLIDENGKFLHTGVDCASTLTDHYTNTNIQFSASHAIKVIKKRIIDHPEIDRRIKERKEYLATHDQFGQPLYNK